MKFQTKKEKKYIYHTDRSKSTINIINQRRGVTLHINKTKNA